MMSGLDHIQDMTFTTEREKPGYLYPFIHYSWPISVSSLGRTTFVVRWLPGLY